MGEYFLGAQDTQIIRLSCGSPASIFVFSDVTNAFAIDNIGVSGILFRFDDNVIAGSVSGYLAAGQMRSFDSRIGSISIMGISGGTSEVQCFRLT